MIATLCDHEKLLIFAGASRVCRRLCFDLLYESIRFSGKKGKLVEDLIHLTTGKSSQLLKPPFSASINVEDVRRA